MVLAYSLFFLIAISVIYYFWPQSELSSFGAALKITQAIGIGLFIAFLAWVFFFSLILNVGFEFMMVEIAKINQDVYVRMSFFQAIKASMQLLKETIWMRIAWVFLLGVVALLFPFMTIFISQFGLCHMSLLDGFDLALGLQGADGAKRVQFIQSRFSIFLISGAVSGLVATFLLPTFLLWVFWLPSLFAGCYLFVKRECL